MTKLFVIEGIDGSGKATQTKLMMEDPSWKLFSLDRVEQISFPKYDNHTGPLISSFLGGNILPGKDDYFGYIKAMSSLYSLNRYEVMYKNFEDALKYNECDVLLADRYTTSNILHMGAKLSKLDNFGTLFDEYLAWLYELEYEILKLPIPEAVIYLYIPAEVSMNNIRRRNSEVGAKVDGDINETYHELCAAEMVGKMCCEKLGWIRVDCSENGEVLSPEEIHKKVKSIITEKYLDALEREMDFDKVEDPSDEPSQLTLLDYIGRGSDSCDSR